MRTAVAAFSEHLELLRSMLTSLESLVLLDGPLPPAPNSSPGEQLPEVLRNVHEYFIHVAACVGRAAIRLEALRTSYASLDQLSSVHLISHSYITCLHQPLDNFFSITSTYGCQITSGMSAA